LVVPTHRPMIRKDHPDSIYKTEKSKFSAVADEIAKNYKVGRPVLVGTTSIEKNEYLSRLLNQKGIPHQLLNAKQHEKEAIILAEAGKKGAVTVATNMAGRGVDIILGKKVDSKEHDEVVELGGLYVIGTERHESRRIDNQLRGRAGRQGDPGETRFFVALEDDLMRIFGGEQISKLMTFFNFPEDQPLSHNMVSKAIEQAQVKVEGYNFDIRKHLVDFDDVLNKQREIIYDLRRNILTSLGEKTDEFKKIIFDVFQEEFNLLVNNFLNVEQKPKEEEIKKLTEDINFILPIDIKEVKKHLIPSTSLTDYLVKICEEEYKKREKKYGEKIWNEVTKVIFLSTIDKYWTDHLTAIEDLREGINLRGYAQLDPLVEYKNEAFSMFERLVGDINYEATRRLFKIEIEGRQQPAIIQKEESQPVVYKSASGVDPFKQKEVSSTQTHLTTSQSQKQPVMEELGFKVTPPGEKARKLGRNDPCWCGSGKKYKRCHYPN